MSRPKSLERIQADADKAIRKERRERKRTEREAKRTIRARKRATHEHVAQNGIPKVQSGGAHLGIHDAIGYSPLVLCGGCGDAIRESILIGDLCPKCKYKKEVVDSPECLKAKQGDALEGGQVGRPSAQDERRSA
jgi:hypothetical protein